MSPNTRWTERGSVLPLMVLAMVLAAVIAMGIARIGGAARDRAQAQTAADAAALAGAAEGPGAAKALAEANGAHLVSYRQEGLDTSVDVEVGPARASGRAHRDDGTRAPVFPT
ncbi:MAG: pilus assembly protein TadG-related protein [Actinomycetota bacterium]|nr:pilus assembly protein TadG-related protein [Actinomycetota bacterium]